MKATKIHDVTTMIRAVRPSFGSLYKHIRDKVASKILESVEGVQWHSKAVGDNLYIDVPSVADSPQIGVKSVLNGFQGILGVESVGAAITLLSLIVIRMELGKIENSADAIAKLKDMEYSLNHQIKADGTLDYVSIYRLCN